MKGKGDCYGHKALFERGRAKDHGPSEKDWTDTGGTGGAERADNPVCQLCGIRKKGFQTGEPDEDRCCIRGQYRLFTDWGYNRQGYAAAV